METKINVAEILKDKPQGTKLYSSACGKCNLKEVDDKSFKISFYNSKFGFMNGGEGYLDKNGKLYDDGECVVFPSKEMRDWSKFAWKKGDVLINSCGFQCIFKEWSSDDYTKFNGCYSNSRDGYEDVSNAETAKFDKLDNNIAYGYVREIERKLGGILNLETLKIEKAQPEFKDGDIVIQGVLKGINVYIIKNCIDKIDNKYNYYARYNTQDKEINYDDWSHISPFAKFATDSEKQQLFEALAKENKAWNAETKTLEDLPKKCEFKPFDKVLVRNTDTEEWFPGFFEKFDSTWNYPYHIMNRRSMTDFAFKQCIPYEGNEHLLGTTKDVEG